MTPDKSSDDQAGAPLSPQSTREAAANIVRSQIDSLYTGGGAATPSLDPALDDINPYERTHAEHVNPQIEQWKQYHSAWQTYYQKYYEGYYTQQLTQTKKALEAQTGKTQNATPTGYFSQQPSEPTNKETLNREEAIFDLRQKLLSQVKKSAKKVRTSRHFVPITAALVVMIIFAFLQYNQVIVANVMAYVSPGDINPQNIVIDPNTDVVVSPDPKLIIPKINVDVPVAYGVGNDYASQMAAMANGVAQFAIPGASSHPGQVGNTAIAGHSSNDLLDRGSYKFIFAQLDKLNVGDTVYANYESKRYTYTVTKIDVVKPDEVNKLVYPTTKPMMTLITCTPLGTALNRLLVTAEQVSPDPSLSTAAPASAGTTAPTTIPGTQPTLVERLFGAN